MSRKLVIDDGTRQRELQLVDRLVVGRDPSCDISADHSLLSRRHAEFVTAGTVVTVRDLGSRNGVFVNGNRAAERMLSPGDVVQIGPLRARYVLDSAPLSITPEALDGDRTAMLQSPVAAAAARTPTHVPAPVLPKAVVLEDTVVPGAPVDEDVTRMVPAPRPIAASDPKPPLADDEEVTRFTSAPGPPIEVNAVLRPAPVAAPPESPGPADTVVAPAPVLVPPAPAAASPVPVNAAADVEISRGQAPLPSQVGDPGLSSFVLASGMAIGGIAAVGSFTAASIIPGLGGLVAGVVIGLGVAFGVAGAINRRVDAVVARAGERS